MKTLLKCVLVGWVLGIILCSCAGSRHLAPAPLSSAQPLAHADAPPAPPLHSTVVVPRRTLLDRALGRPARPQAFPATSSVRAGKKSTINQYYGPAVVSTTTVGKTGAGAAGPAAQAARIDKPKAATATGNGATATDQRRSQQAAAVRGNGNQLKQTMPAPPPPKPSPWLRYVKLAGVAAGVLGGGWLVLSGLLALGVALPGWLVPLLWRRKSAS